MVEKMATCPICEKEIDKHSKGQFLVCQNKLTGEMAGT